MQAVGSDPSRFDGAEEDGDVESFLRSLDVVGLGKHVARVLTEGSADEVAALRSTLADVVYSVGADDARGLVAGALLAVVSEFVHSAEAQNGEEEVTARRVEVQLSEAPDRVRDIILSAYPGAVALSLFSERPPLFRVRVGDVLLVPGRLSADEREEVASWLISVAGPRRG